MNLPIDTCENGACSFAIRGEYDDRVYAKNLGLKRGGRGGISRQRQCAWCINCADGCASTLTLHYHKEGWSNFLGTGSSKMLATAVIVILEV